MDHWHRPRRRRRSPALIGEAQRVYSADDAAPDRSSQSESQSQSRSRSNDALEQIRFIRQTMESAGSFTLVPGIGQIAIGLTALPATYLASRASDAPHWLAIWVAEAALAMLIAGFAMVRKARAARQVLFSGPAKKFAFSFFPPLIAGSLITLLMYKAGADLITLLPAIW